MAIGIVAQRDNERGVALAERIARAVDVAVVVDETTAAALPDDAPVGARAVDRMDECSLVVIIGGDGTFLYAARGAGSTPLVGVNLGEVGFLNAVAPEDAVGVVTDLVATIQAGEPLDTHTLPRVQASGPSWSLPPAMNEVVVTGPRRGPGGGVDVRVVVDGAEYASGHADGVLVATPTGSTAYNLSEGGPLVHPGVDGLVVTGMAARSGVAPLVVAEDATVTVDVADADHALVVGDGRVRRTVDVPTTVTLERAADPVTIAGPEREFFTALTKLD